MSDQREMIPTAKSSTHRLTILYVLALSAVAVLTLAGQVLVQQSLEQQLSDSTVVNIAGRQRMLSQKITKLALQMHTTDSLTQRAEDRRELRDALQQWETSHVGLQTGNTELGLPGKNSDAVTELYARLEPEYVAIDEAAQQLLQQNDNDFQQNEISPALQAIMQHESDYLVGMNEIVYVYSQEAESRVASLRQVEHALLVITLAVLLFEGLFVFRPAVRQLQQMFQRLRENAEDLKLAKESAEAANQEKTRFLAKMSHELRTPMNAILGLSEVLLRGELSMNEKKLINTIHDSALSLMALLNDLLDMSKLEVESSLTLSREPINPKLICEKVVEMFAHQAKQQGLQLGLHVSEELDMWVLGDEYRLRQIMVNLVQNALKFTRQRQISIEAEVQRHMAHEVVISIAITDTGPGISHEDQELIFEPFKQAGHSSGQHGGAGLGLSIVHHLVEAMKGRIRVVSQVGEGTAFIIELPLERADGTVRWNQPSVETTISSRKAQDLARLDVLVVEDIDANRLVAGAMLDELSVSHRFATSIAEGFERLNEKWPDIILLDLELPDGDGFSFFNKLVARSLEINRYRPVVVALTAHAIEDFRKKTEAAGMDGFLTKPVTLDGLRRVLGLVPEFASHSFDQYESEPEEEEQDDDPLASYPKSLRDKLLQNYCECYHLHYDQLLAAKAEGDPKRFAYCAHKLLGLVANFGPNPALDHLRMMDNDSFDLSQPDLDETLDRLRIDLDELANLATRKIAYEPS